VATRLRLTHDPDWQLSAFRRKCWRDLSGLVDCLWRPHTGGTSDHAIVKGMTSSRPGQPVSPPMWSVLSRGRGRHNRVWCRDLCTEPGSGSEGCPDRRPAATAVGRVPLATRAPAPAESSSGTATLPAFRRRESSAGSAAGLSRRETTRQLDISACDKSDLSAISPDGRWQPRDRRGRGLSLISRLRVGSFLPVHSSAEPRGRLLVPEHRSLQVREAGARNKGGCSNLASAIETTGEPMVRTATTRAAQIPIEHGGRESTASRAGSSVRRRT
jgi:hypothetical protein